MKKDQCYSTLRGIGRTSCIFQPGRDTASIDKVLGPATVETLLEGMPNGKNPEWRYDKELIEEIGRACDRFLDRKS